MASSYKFVTHLAAKPNSLTVYSLLTFSGFRLQESGAKLRFVFITTTITSSRLS